MIVEEKNRERMKDLLAACMEQLDQVNRIVIETGTDFERSKLRALLRGNRWPLAVHPQMLVDDESEEDKLSRADSILDWMLGNALEGKKFLDFGCGEGHVALRASASASLAVGYDPEESGWHRMVASPKFLLTSDIQEAAHLGPYDVILVYDVLDHILDDDPPAVLAEIHGMLKDDGKVHVRCHPWCSKHGTHAYKSLNKAFIHMFLTPEELAAMGVKTLPTRKIIHPITTYDDWFVRAGFKKVGSGNVLRDEVEPFFEQEDVLCRMIKDHWKDSYEERLSSGKVFPRHQLEQQFLDFVLVKEKK